MISFLTERMRRSWRPLGAICLAASLISIAPAQNRRKVYVHHSDPYLLALLINGKTTFLTAPEISCIFKTTRWH